MDAQQYYTQGVTSIKNGDMVNGRKYLLQSLKMNRNNDRAWLWLSRTIAENDKKLECVERALAINPNNQDALHLKSQLGEQPQQTVKAKRNNNADSQRVRALLQEADQLVRSNRQAEAVDKWVMVLDIEHDHEIAMKNAVQYFADRDMLEDAKILLYNAVDLGTHNAMILLSARDLASKEFTMERYDHLCEMISAEDWVTPKQVLTMTKGYIKNQHYDNAIRILQNALKVHPDEPELLTMIAKVHEATGRETVALQYYERVANSGMRSQLGKEADKRLSMSVPIMTDKERGSAWMAWREVFGIFALFFLLAFMDAGLNLLNMGAGRWMGVILSLVGSYLVVTATSSPQQQPIAAILGGVLPPNNPKSPERRMSPFAQFIVSLGMQIDEESYYVGPIHEPTRLPIIPEWIRWVFAIAGFLMLIFAFYLVMSTAIGLLGLPDINLDPQFWEAISEFTS